MGLFQKFKEKLIGKKELVENVSEKVTVENEEILTEEEKDVITYDKGLEKTRKEFVSQLSLLGKKFTKVNEEYFEELESLLIRADIGVNTVFKFLERLRKRVKYENICPALKSKTLQLIMVAISLLVMTMFLLFVLFWESIFSWPETCNLGQDD